MRSRIFQQYTLTRTETRKLEDIQSVTANEIFFSRYFRKKLVMQLISPEAKRICLGKNWHFE